MHNLSTGKDGSLGWQALLEQGSVYASEDWPGALPTRGVASDIFIANARAAAVTYSSVLLKFSQYPYKLANLIHPKLEFEVEALCFLSAKKCSLDAFSQHLRGMFPSVPLLATPLCRNMLGTAFSMYDITTFSTERLHSQNARQIFSRPQTHKLSLHQLAVLHSGIGAPSALMPLLPKARPPLAQKRVGVEVHGDRGQRPLKKARGGGGAWRAFVFLDTLQRSPSRPAPWNFKERNLSERYRNLSVEERQVCEELGKAACKLHQNRQRSFPKTYSKAWLDLQHAHPHAKSAGAHP